MLLEGKMNEEIERTVPIIQEWAKTIRIPNKIYLYGSRINGEPREDSDLDVGIELVGIDDSELMMRHAVVDQPAWQNQLNALLPFDIDLELYRDISISKDEMTIFPSGTGSYLIYDSENDPPENIRRCE